MESEFGITNLGTYIVSVAMILALPGPNVLAVLTNTARNGYAGGAKAAAGVLTGDGILLLITVFLGTTLFTASPGLLNVVRILGAIYIFYLGASMLHGLFNKQHNSGAQRSNTSGGFRSTLIISLLNPKGLLFFSSFIVQFVDPNYAYPRIPLMLLGLILQLINVVYLTILVFFGVQLSKALADVPLATTIGVSIVGVLFIMLAIQLLLSRS